jgi:hypothetical protein
MKVTKEYREKISRRMREVWAERRRMRSALREIEERRKADHCYGTYCHYLTERRCICTCRSCGECRKRDL